MKVKYLELEEGCCMRLHLELEEGCCMRLPLGMEEGVFYELFDWRRDVV